MTDFLHAPSLAVRHQDALPDESCYCPREHARRLGITEADLIEMDEGSASARLRPHWPTLLAALRTLGPTVAQTCNADAMLETAGTYPMLQGDTSVGSFAGHTIDLRLLLSRWTDVWAVKRGGGISLQVFGRDGSAVHKVYLTDSSNRAGWMQLLEGHIAVDVHDPEIAAFAAPRIGSGCERVLDRMAATGLDASRPAGSARARKVAAGSCRSLLQAVAEARLPIDVVVGNSGCVHTCKGLVATLRVSPPWLVGLGSRGMLRLREAAIAEAWLVYRQTDYGMVSTLELFDRSGSMIATLSGRHGANLAEERRWQAMLDEIPQGVPPPGSRRSQRREARPATMTDA